MYYVTCTTICNTVKQRKTEGPKASLYVKLWRSVVFVIAPASFFVLVFHLKQKHEEGQRLLHYLQQTNPALATGTFIYIYIYIYIYTINQGICRNEIKSLQSSEFSLNFWNVCRNVWIATVINILSALGNLCNYGYSLSNICTWYYWYSFSFS